MDLIPNLIFLYHTMVASENLLVVASAHAPDALNLYFNAHLEEERGHAQWLAEDLQSVGIDVKRTQIPVQAMEMVGSVYYLIFHADPVALLGYMLTLENPIPLEQIERLEALHSPQLLRTLRYHAVHDIGHARDLRAVITSLTDEQRALVYQTAQQTRRYIERAAQTDSQQVSHGSQSN